MKYKTYIALSLLFTLFAMALFCLYNMILDQYQFFTVNGTSMNPILIEGDTVMCLEQEDYEVGDIIVFNNIWRTTPPFKTCHRIIYKQEDLFLTQGDNETEIDPGVQRLEDIICKVVGTNRRE